MGFIDVLNDIWEKHEMLYIANIRKSYEESSLSMFPREELMLDEKITTIMCFLIQSCYSGIISKAYDDITDLEIDLFSSPISNIDKIYKLFKSLKDDLSNEQILNILSFILKYDLDSYSSKDNDIALKKWIINKLPFGNSLFGNWSRISVIQVFENTFRQLGVNSNKGTLLIRGDNTYLTKKILSGHFLDWKGVYLFYPLSKRFWQNINLIIAFSKGDNSVQCLDYSSDMTDIFPIEQSMVEGIICIGQNYSNKNIPLDKVYSYVSNDGFCLVFSQSIKQIIDRKSFKNYNIPIIFENKDINEKVYLCIKNSSPSDTIRICDTETQVSEEQAYVIKRSTKAILEESFSKNYQKLSKMDFLHAKNGDISFDNIRRPLDQIDFSYTELSNLISDKSNNSKLFGLIEDSKIIEKFNLSSNPFNINVPDFFYIDISHIEKQNYSFYDNVDFEVRKNGYVFPDWPEEYVEKYISLQGLDHLTEEQKFFLNRLTCKICTEQSLLMYGNQIIQVNASPDKPVCYRAYRFWDDPQGFIGYVQIKEIEINPKFDKDFVIYQISKMYKGGRYILTLPDKTAQHEYYLKKLDEYKLDHADLIKFVRQETLKELSSEIHNIKHTATNRLSPIQNIMSTINRVLRRKGQLLSDELIGDETICDKLDKVKKISSKASDDLETLASIIDNDKPYPENIYSLIEEYTNNIVKSSNYKLIIKIDERLRDKFCLLDKSIFFAFDNIILNAERHAFNDCSKENVLEITANLCDNCVEIRFADKGTPPDTNLTEDVFFSYGKHVGKFAHTGHGGALIKKYVEKQGGVTRLLLNNEEYPFIIQIKLPFYYEHN